MTMLRGVATDMLSNRPLQAPVPGAHPGRLAEVFLSFGTLILSMPDDS